MIAFGWRTTPLIGPNKEEEGWQLWRVEFCQFSSVLPSPPYPRVLFQWRGGACSHRISNRVLDVTEQDVFLIHQKCMQFKGSLLCFSRTTHGTKSSISTVAPWNDAQMRLLPSPFPSFQAPEFPRRTNISPAADAEAEAHMMPRQWRHRHRTQLSICCCPPRE